MKKLLNSAVEVSSRKRIEASKAAMNNAGLSVEQWNAILFEMGCAFVERWVKPSYMQQCLLNTPELGFWNWWTVQFMDDDMDFYVQTAIDVCDYTRNKKLLLETSELLGQFEYFLQRKNIQAVYEKV